MPWSIKGVEEETRHSAKAAAQAAGMTIGDWLDQTIRKIAAAEIQEFAPEAQDAAPNADAAADDGGPHPGLQILVTRIDELERNSTQTLLGLNRALDKLAARLDAPAAEPPPKARQRL